jgi:tetratricopeptide (TPR) repeat protein
MTMLRAFFFFTFIISTCFAQKKTTPTIVVGRQLTYADSVRIKELFFDALKEKTRQNYTEAGNRMRQILEINPADPAALYELASLLHGQNQDFEAEKFARDAVTVASGNKWNWLLLADIYKKTRNFDQLVLVFDELIKISPAEKDYYFDKANALLIQNKRDEAAKIYEDMESRFGSSETLITAKQRLYQKQGNSVQIAAELEKQIAQNPNEVKNYMNLSEVYLKSGNLKKTIEILNKAKEINANDPFIRLALADAFKAQGQNTEAFNELRAAFADPTLNIDAKIQIALSLFPEFKDPNIRKETVALASVIPQVHPADPKSHAVYGDVLYQNQQFDEAKTSYKKALSLNDQVYQIWEQLLNIQIYQRDFQAAIKDGEEALSLFPNQAALYFYTAIAYSQINKAEKAISYLKNAADLQVDDNGFLSQIYSALGDSYNSLSKFKESDQAYEKALELNPNNAHVLNNYAYYLSLREQSLDKAASMSKRSNEIEPGNASFEDTYAWVLFKQKKYKEALVWIEKAIKGSKDNSTQLEHYGDILFNLGEKEKALEQWKLAQSKGARSIILEKKIHEKKYTE